MYNTNQRTETSYNDAKYTVADILSSMANGNSLTPTTDSYPVISTATHLTTTPILTPTTLASIERTFMELSSSPGMSSQPQHNRQPTMTQSGFVPPLVQPVQSLVGAAQNAYACGSPYMMDESTGSDSDADWIPPDVKRARVDGVKQEMSVYASKPNITSTNLRGAGRKPSGPRRQRYEMLSPDEELRRGVRRERNKVAAAKCRQRRVDQTNTLQEETDCLEEERGKLEQEIQTLQQQKEQLEFLLEAHKPMCSKVKSNQNCSTNSADSTEENFANLIRVEAVGETNVTTSTAVASLVRPNTLPLNKRTNGVVISEAAMTAATGVSVNTPSTGVYATLTLDSMVDHTGLTPLMTGNIPCSTIANRSSSDSSSDTLASPTTLLAL